MTIRKKLYYFAAGMVAVVTLLASVSLTAIFRTRTAKENSTHSIQVLEAVNQVKMQMYMNRLNLRNYLLSGSPADLKKEMDGADDLQSRIKKAQDYSNTSERASLDAVAEAELNWQRGFAGPLIDKRKQVDAGNATVADLQILYMNLDPGGWVAKTNVPLGQAEDAIKQDFKTQSDSDERASNISMWLAVLFAVLAVGGGITVTMMMAKSITEPLGHLIDVTAEMAERGDLDQKVDLNRDDEIGAFAKQFANMVAYLKEMASVSEAIAGGDLTVDVQPRSQNDTLGLAFSEMVASLRKMVQQVRDSATQVSSGSTQVASASDESAKINMQAAAAIDEVTSTMHEMSINVQNMVKNTQTQASSVSETSASIDEMVASIQRVADTAKVLLDISQRSREEVQSGIGTMNKATDGLNRINTSIQSSSQIIGALGTRADDIGKIVEVIDDLAEQTNLLALNAAIEAARAGEHGLGFAVVADEVRKLAEKSAQSTREISELIGSIQKEAKRAVENMEKSTTIVDEGLNLGTELSVALKKISNVVTEVYKFAQEIGAATNEQSHGSSQIARATTRLNEITHEINSAVEEQASGAQAVVRAMEKMRELTQRGTSGSTELAASAEQMSKMAKFMLDSMDRFALEVANGHYSNGHSNGRASHKSDKPLVKYAAATAAGSFN